MANETFPVFIDITPPLTENACMDSTLILRGIHIAGHCGVTHQERNEPQPILVDLELDCANSHSAVSDHLGDTIDYAQIIKRISDIGTQNHFSLVESLADKMAQTLFDEFPIRGLSIWVRKTAPPLTHQVDSVGVRLSRLRSRPLTQSLSVASTDQPSSFLVDQQHHIPKGRILDVATGHGRNAIYLASQGFSVTGVDRDPEAIHSLKQKTQSLGLARVTALVQDLENGSTTSIDFGENTYDGILVFFYLYRALFPSLIRALKPGGVLVYETFLIDNHVIHNHPRRKEFCLHRNELLRLTPGMRIVHYEEGAHQGPHNKEPAFTARMIAEKEQPNR